MALRAITTPANAGSIAFHRSLKFEPVDGGGQMDQVPVVPHYAGPGQHRVVLLKRLDVTQPLAKEGGIP